MMRIIYTLALFGVIIGTTANIISQPGHWRWLFNVKDKPVTEASKDERSLCDSNQCKTLGKILKQSMNETVDPCEDFYEYACGNWAVHNPRPKDTERWNLLYKTQKIVDKRLLDILNEDSSESLFSVRLAKRAYKACMDTDAIESRGVQPILSTLWRIGGWPLIMEENEWAEEIYKWKIVDDYYANLIGLTSLYDIKMGELDWSIDTISLLIDTPHLPYKLYRFLKSDDILEPDSSDEDNDSPEGSQERGSEERRRSEEEKSDESDDEESEDEEEPQKKRLAKKGNNRRLGFGKRKHNKINGTKKHARKHNMKRIRRAIIKANNHKMRQHKQKKVTSHSTHHATKKEKRVSSQHHVNGPVRKNSRNQRRKEDTNSDIYFHNENEGDVDLEKVNNKKAKDDNDEDGTDTESKGGGSGNGDDDTEWEHGNDSGSSDDENDSGSGDDENDSGSGDDENDSDSGDDENDSGSGDDDNKGDEENEELRKKYVEYMLNVSSALAQARGVPIPKEKLVEGVNELMEFEVELLKLIINCEEPMNTTLREFQKSYDALNNTAKTRINWIRSVQDLFSLGGIEIDEDEIVGITSFEYVKAIRKLLEETPSRIIVNYIHWNFVSRVLKATTKEMTDLYYEWEGNKPDQGRSDECIDEIEAKYCLGYEYVKRHFSDDILQTASDMIDDIEKEVEYQVEEATWMDDDTRDFILDKLVYLKKILGYPSAYRNATAMRESMQGLSISPSHYENKLGIMRHVKRQNLRRFYGKEGLKVEQFIDPLMVNAFFMFSENAIEITAADFQSPMFDSRQPWYTNFGIIGFIISHEVNHGFDDTGHMFDKEGKYVKWLSAMAEAYDERAECFEDQYTRYSVIENRTGNMSIKDYGEQTIGENIADSMGLQAVYRAYQRRQRECKKPDPMLPGLQDFSNDQIFFISNAYLWCEDVSEEGLTKKVRQDSHSLGPLRVIGPVSNSEDFAKAFSCPVGSPMNPKKKCNIWK